MLKLDALNIVLDAVGVYPVTQWESSHPDAVRARQQVMRHDVEIQGRGWWCNREYNLVLSPDTSTHEIVVPAGTLFLDNVDPQAPYVKRGERLYDPREHTFKFTNSIKVHTIMQLEYVDLPYSLQVYIARAAAVDFAVVHEGDQQKIQTLEKMLYQARSQAFSDELRDSNYNVFNTGLPRRVHAGMRPAVRRG